MQLSPVEGWIGVIEVALYILGSGAAAIAAAIITSRHAQRAGRPLRDQVDSIAMSVNNGHEVPLREDLDEIRATLHALRRDQADVRLEIGEMRDEFRSKRAEISELQRAIANCPCGEPAPTPTPRRRNR